MFYIIDVISLGFRFVKIIDVYQEFLRDVTELILTFDQHDADLISVFLMGQNVSI